MGINRSNYEAYFLDYLEGNLSDEEVREMEIFLQLNPELKQEMEGFEMIPLEGKDEAPEALKSKLKREEQTGLSYSDYLLISSVENVQTDVEKEQYSALLKAQPELLKEQQYYEATKAHHSPEIVFPDKRSLKRKEAKVIHLQWYAYAAAAAILLVVFFRTGFLVQPAYEPHQVAIKNDLQQLEQPSAEQASEMLSNKNLVLQEDGVPREGGVEEGEIREEQFAMKKNQNQQQDLDQVKEQREAISTFLANKETESEETPVVKEQEVQEHLAQTELPETIQEEIPEEVSIVPQEDIVPSEDSEELADNTSGDENAENEVLPITDYAKQKLKKDVLKNKSFKEFLVNEFVELTNNSISVKTQKDAEGKNELIALNIGSFSFLKKK